LTFEVFLVILLKNGFYNPILQLCEKYAGFAADALRALRSSCRPIGFGNAVHQSTFCRLFPRIFFLQMATRKLSVVSKGYRRHISVVR